MVKIRMTSLLICFCLFSTNAFAERSFIKNFFTINFKEIANFNLMPMIATHSDAMIGSGSSLGVVFCEDDYDKGIYFERMQGSDNTRFDFGVSHGNSVWYSLNLGLSKAEINQVQPQFPVVGEYEGLSIKLRWSLVRFNVALHKHADGKTGWIRSTGIGFGF